MIADHRCELEAIDVGHVDVDEDNSDVVFQQQLKRFRGIAGAQQVLANIGQDGPIGQKLRGLIVDEEYVDFVVKHGVHKTQRCSQPRSADSSCSVFTGFAR